uniref:TFIIS N-terminal domain-containing protein n=1 Tax=Pseudictyota dubia TaxID=2749911 RepID=A0A7R9W9Q2_9STRA|mmetsp:Transcript_40968/g.75776  ORF Transcript_40968/g.75776 Transcript_40968/m.75776 type:complete len:538 (+) Transcript_40968:10-1623(+)
MLKSQAPSVGSRTRSVPSLALLCMEAISSKIERYPPECLGVLSESEWDSIVRCRHRKTAPKQGHGSAAGKVACTGNKIKNSITSKTGGLDGTGRLVPAISGQVMTAIEEACPRFKCSSVADDLVWKDCVEYKFRTGGPSRPRAFQYPWDLLVARLKRSGEDLVELLKPPCKISAVENTEEGESMVDASLLHRRGRVLERSIKVMSDAPMSVALLKSSGVGKSVQNFIKQCGKLHSKGGDIPAHVVDVWSERRIEGLNLSPLGHTQSRSVHMSPLEQLQRLLQGWKNVASSSGVEVTNGSDSHVEDCSGRDKKTTAEQHDKDMKMLQKCKQWRDIYYALLERESKMMENHGKRMRKIRENLNTDRPKISQLNFKAAGRRDRREAILGGARGVRAMTAAGKRGMFASASPSDSKMQQLRKETAIIASRQVPVGVATKQSHTSGRKSPAKFGFTVANAKTLQRKPAVGFGASVASATASRGVVGTGGSKRKAPSGQRSVALSGGKKLKALKKAGGGVFSSIQQKREIATKKAYLDRQRRR